jgi:Flp pilus assembly pilin Flp
MIASAARSAHRERGRGVRSVRMLVRLLFDETDGQDIVEYALLAAFVAVASIAGLNAVQTALGTTYTSWETKTQLLSCMPDPGGLGCP